MLDLQDPAFSFDPEARTRRRRNPKGDRLKHLAWIIPVCVFLLIVGLCVDYALQSKDRENFSTETYMQELEGRVLRAMTWSTYVPNPERDQDRQSGGPFLQLVAPGLDGDMQAAEIQTTKPGKGQTQAEDEAIDLSEQGAAALEFFRFAERIAEERAREPSPEQQAQAGEPSPPVVRRGGSAGGGSTFGAGSGCQLVDGVRRC